MPSNSAAARTRTRRAAAAVSDPPPSQRTMRFGEEDARAVTDRVARLDAALTGDTADGITAYDRPPPRPDIDVPGLVLRSGRILRDGSRRGARWVAKRTAYLSPKHAAALDSYARVHDLSLGEAMDLALEKAGIVGKAAS